MVAPLDCPGMECWDALFRNALPEDQREDFERHLESCPACQERLDRPEEFGALLRKRARRVGDPTVTPPDPTLSQVLERLHGVKSPLHAAAADPADLYFLRPTDRPDLLGTLGNYEVQEVIGQGGMGVVLKAFDPALHRLVAIKVMAAAVAGSATARRRFTREAQAAAAVCHDHVVAVHGVHEADGLPYLVMQYVPGESLQARLDCTGPLEVVEVVRIGMQTASGLAAAHAQGLIHRDIKPANLLLENGLARVKISDFGLARMADDVRLTQSGVLAGTPEYMAPEQARGEAVDHRADLFSLGSVLYATCTGRPPFRGSSTVAVLRRVSDEEPQPVRSLNPEVPAWLETVVMRLLAKDPARRFQSAAEVAALLEGYLAHLRQPEMVPAPVLPPSPFGVQTTTPVPSRLVKRFPRRYWLPALVLLSLLGLGGALWLALVEKGNDAKVDAQAAPPIPVEESRLRSRGGLAMVLHVGLGVTFALVALVSLGFYLRQRAAARRLSAGGTQQSTTPGSVAVPCPECGRNLKIKAELAGKKVKCPQCGKALVAPQPTRPAKTGFISLATGLLAVLGLVFLCFWTFWPRTSPITSFLDIPLGNRSVPGVADSGFYYDENDNEGPFRWTNGKGKLVIPLAENDRPQALLVQLDRLENCSLQIIVNNREVLKEEPSPNRVIWWEKTIDLRGVLLGKEVIKEVIVEIVSNTRPDQNDISRREIGVTVRGIKLLSRRGDDNEEEKMRSSSFLNVTLGNHIVPGIEESGFHPTERSNDGRFRWTKGKARLVIPLDKKERPQAILVQL